MFTHLRFIRAAAAVTGVLIVSNVAAADPPQMTVEIFRIAPGHHAEFLRMIAAFDQVNVEAGVPPRQLFVHQSGDGWDFMLLQPYEYSDEIYAKLDAAAKRLGLPEGGKYFVEIRRLLASHTDTVVEGPTTAADWLKKLE